VRYRADGNLEFLGRIDHQVKVRGFRIELGEIEAVLRGQVGVNDAVALVREDTPGDQRLVAYVVRDPEVELHASDLRAAMRSMVAEHMVPSFFVLLEEFPLTPSGKVDRSALPPPEGRAAVQTEYVAPRNQIEHVLAETCAEILGVAKVGVYDDFFELGGHSLLATQFMSRAQEKLGVAIPLRALFEHSHVASLAEVVEKAKTESARPETPAIVPLSREVRRVKRSALTGKRPGAPAVAGDAAKQPGRLEGDG
jgi:acyl carrier protein